MRRPTWRRQFGKIGRRRCRLAEMRRHILGGVGGAIGGAACQFLSRRAAIAAHQRAHFIEAGIDHVLGLGHAAACARRGAPAASAARRMRPEAQISL